MLLYLEEVPRLAAQGQKEGELQSAGKIRRREPDSGEKKTDTKVTGGSIETFMGMGIE